MRADWSTASLFRLIAVPEAPVVAATPVDGTVSPAWSLLEVEISFSLRDEVGPPFNLRSISEVSIAFLTSSSLSRI